MTETKKRTTKAKVKKSEAEMADEIIGFIMSDVMNRHAFGTVLRQMHGDHVLAMKRKWRKMMMDEIKENR